MMGSCCGSDGCTVAKSVCIQECNVVAKIGRTNRIRFVVTTGWHWSWLYNLEWWGINKGLPKLLCLEI